MLITLCNNKFLASLLLFNVNDILLFQYKESC